MKRLKRHLTFANVVAGFCLFVVLGGGAYAATQLPRNSVGTVQLKAGAVTAGKIAKKARNQLRGSRGPTGAQGKIGKTGAKGPKGATGNTGARGAQGEAGTGPAFEVFGTNKSISSGGSAIVAENLGSGAYVVSANVAIESSVETTVTCTLNGGGGAVGYVESGVPTTLSLSVTRNIGSAGNATLTCSAPGGATVKYANVIATQVKSQSRVAG
jgi:hypothetical protein